MIEVYYSKYVPQALFFIKDNYFKWSDRIDWSDNHVSINYTSDNVIIKLFEIEE